MRALEGRYLGESRNRAGGKWPETGMLRPVSGQVVRCPAGELPSVRRRGPEEGGPEEAEEGGPAEGLILPQVAQADIQSLQLCTNCNKFLVGILLPSL